MLSTWFIPSFSGDYRLTAHPDAPDERCLLVVTDPTAAEQEILSRFLAAARKKDKPWIDELAGVSREGETRLTINAPMSQAGHALAVEATSKRGTLTVVASKDGDVMLEYDGVPDEQAIDEAAETASEAAGKEKEPDKAVTTRRPTLCCPTPIPGPIVRASQVLHAFSTPSQWLSWIENGWMIVYGGLTGYAYRIVHRHHPLAREQGKITWDLTHDRVVHAHASELPAPEEALTMKLVLESRFEDWIRNPSALLGMGRDGLLFDNPHGSDTMEGTWDASLLRGVGAVAPIFEG